jgi:uncharacterized protein YkwD
MIAKLVFCLMAALLLDGASAAPTQPAREAQAPPQVAAPSGGPVQPASHPEPAGDRPASEKPGGAKSADEEENDLLAIEANIISYTNRERARYGLPPMQVCPELMDSARRHCAWMARSRRLVHTSQPVAENIATGQSSSNEVVRDWMRSSGHRANILNAGHRRIGVAAYRTPSGTIYWCQQFRR